MVAITYSHYWQLWMRVALVTFEKKGGVILECMFILLSFEIKWILYEIIVNSVIDWNKLPFSKLSMDLVYIFQCSDA